MMRFMAMTNSFMLVLLLLAISTGCQSVAGPRPGKQGQSLGRAIDPVRLMAELRIQMDEALAEVIAFSTEIAATHAERRIRESTLRWKMRYFDDYLFILTIDDPRAAFLLEWTAIVQLRKHVTEAAWEYDPTGQIKQKAIAAMTKIEKDIVNLGYRNFPRETIKAAKDEIEKSAHYVPWHSPAGYEAAITKARQENDLLAILTLPLEPIADLKKVGDTPEAINQFSNTVQDFSVVVQHWPERTRWQLELLLLEMESSGPVLAMTKQADRLDETIRKMGQVFQSLPKEAGAEFERSLAATERLQPELRATLDKARVVAENIAAAVETANKTVLQTQEAASGLTEAARAFETAAGEMRGLLADYSEIRKERAEETERKGAGVEDYQEAAESFAAAALEIRSGLAELQKPLDERAALRQVANEFRAVVNLLFWRSVMLVTIIFALVLGFHLVKSRVTQNPRNI